ncbi:hypothetical protein MRY82_06735 [bacterium]|nr:hypothetical protein [bacterium]
MHIHKKDNQAIKKKKKPEDPGQEKIEDPKKPNQDNKEIRLPSDTPKPKKKKLN